MFKFASGSGDNFKNLNLLNPLPTKRTGGAMTIRTRNCARAEKLQDVLMLSSFGFWALLLGLGPILIYHSLIS